MGGIIMIMTSFLKNRRSVREFKRKSVDLQILKKVKEYLGELEKEGSSRSIKFNLYENGDNLYKSLEGIGGYAGVMIQSPHYISLGLMNDDEKNIIYSAYFMEKLISKLNELGLDTCWISIGGVKKADKDKALGDKKETINYLLAIGHSKPKNPFVNESFSERIGVDELVFSNSIGNPSNLEELENRGLSDLFYYIRFAPSARNKQPWRFLLEDNKVVLLLEKVEGEELDLIDAGIMMYYFENLAAAIGLNSKWKLLGEDYEGENPDYKYIGEFKL